MDIIHYHFTTLNSTNTWGKENAAQWQRDKITLITAEEQTAGRGRQGRSWKSPKGQNVYASLCFFLKEPSLVGNMPHVLALSTLKVLEKYGFQLKLKWPNDLLISGKKVGGVLCEVRSLDDQAAVILGVGLNVNMPKELLETLGRPATSCFIEKGSLYDVQEITHAIANSFAQDLERFMREGFQPFLKLYREHFAYQPGQRVRFHVAANDPIEGAFHSIGDNGSLNLQLDNGTIRNFISGDIL